MPVICPMSPKLFAAPHKVASQARQRRQQQHAPRAKLALQVPAKAGQHEAVGDQVHRVLVQEDGCQPALGAAQGVEKRVVLVLAAGWCRTRPASAGTACGEG